MGFLTVGQPDAHGVKATQNRQGTNSGCGCRYRSPDKSFFPVRNGGIFYSSGECIQQLASTHARTQLLRQLCAMNDVAENFRYSSQRRDDQ